MKGSSGGPAWISKDLFDRWISELQAKEGTKNFRWVFVMKSRRLTANPDRRVLVGGLRNRMRYWKSLTKLALRRG
jgi:hypothetical protein